MNLDAEDIDMVYNPLKSMALHIGNRFNQTRNPLNVTVNNIPFVLKAKYFGFTFCAVKAFKIL